MLIHAPNTHTRHGTHRLIIIIIAYSVIYLVSMHCVCCTRGLEFHPRIAEISIAAASSAAAGQIQEAAIVCWRSSNAFAHRMGLSSGRVKLKHATTHSDYYTFCAAAALESLLCRALAGAVSGLLTVSLHCIPDTCADYPRES